MYRKYIYYIIPLITLFCGCSTKNKPSTESGKFVINDSMFHIISIDTVRLQEMKDVLELSGQISYDENRVVRVYSNTSGWVETIKVSAGDFVSKGQVLAVLKSADVAGSYSDMAMNSADIDMAKRQYESSKILYSKGIASEKDVSDAYNNYKKAMLAGEKISSMLHINSVGGTHPGGTFIVRAPLSGYIVEKKVNAGSFIRSDMGDNLFTIADLTDVWVYANVYESDIDRVRKGEQSDISVLAYPDKVMHARVDKVAPILDADDKAERVMLRLPNNGGLLKPQMFASVKVYNPTGKMALAIPSSALIFDNSTYYVLVYHSRINVEVREVSILDQRGDVTYISSGLNAGDPIISQKGLLIFNALMKD